MSPQIGLHVSAAGGLANAPENARAVAAECFQFFSRSPRGGAAAALTTEQVTLFKQRCREYQYESYIHTPYYINFASRKKPIAQASTRIIREELERGSELGVQYVVTHLGSAREWPGATPAETPREALDQTAVGLAAIYEAGAEFSSVLLLEIAAGAGSVVGDTFEELAYLLEKIGRDDVHICLDTCHLFASGYDIRTTKTLAATLAQFKKRIGFEHLKLIHTNDSKAELGARKDRHEHIGHGHIGEEGFRALLAHPDLNHINCILETPHDDLLAQDIALLKQLRTAN